jgi:hypothetical protein
MFCIGICTAEDGLMDQRYQWELMVSMERKIQAQQDKEDTYSYIGNITNTQAAAGGAQNERLTATLLQVLLCNWINYVRF